jgi:hypothetical protein
MAMVTGWIVTTTGFCGEHNLKKKHHVTPYCCGERGLISYNIALTRNRRFIRE